jgi:exodeoxyribonuclease VII small subunit
MPNPDFSFEEALQRLEEIVAILERGDLPLAQALLTFEEGVSLSRQCTVQLADAEQRVETLSGELVPMEVAE